MKEEIKNLYYTAGLIDGEGSVLLSYKNKTDKFRHPNISLTSTTYSLIEFLKNNYGGHIVSQKVYKKHHKQSWVWKLNGRQAINLLSQLYPFLKEQEKYRRAKLLATKYIKLTPRNGKYTKEQLCKKQDFEKEFFHPSKP